MSLLSLIGDLIVSDYLFMPVRLQCQYSFLDFFKRLYHFFLLFLQFNTLFAFRSSSKNPSIQKIINSYKFFIYLRFFGDLSE